MSTGKGKFMAWAKETHRGAAGDRKALNYRSKHELGSPQGTGGSGMGRQKTWELPEHLRASPRGLAVSAVETEAGPASQPQSILSPS